MSNDTPRTDAGKFGECCATDFARTLERENTQLRAEVERLKDEVVLLNGIADMHMKGKASADAAKRALETTTKALDEMLGEFGDGRLTMSEDQACRKARAALDSAKEDNPRGPNLT